ncbi:MAG: DEAD/DEAH box helicase family protein [Melioribacteraceae bacterium]
MQKEAKARIKINKLLEEAGWRFFDENGKKANVILESNIKIEELGDNFEKTSNGFIDFLLLDDRGYPLIVLEAKSEDKNPLIGKEQSRKYAKNSNCRFVILSNGNLHYFWDLERGNPYQITKFPNPESVKTFKIIKPNPQKLIDEIVNEDYIALTQLPNFAENPTFKNSITRKEFITNNKLRFLRHYQLKAVHSIQRAIKDGNDRFLFEMATGTGKTLVSAAVIKLFLRTGNTHRVLFLVDRLELEDQGYKAFNEYLKNDFKTVIYKENKEDWRKAEIVVTTVQSLMFDNKYRKLFAPTDFNLVISDEAHRSINGNSRAIFEYFVGYKLGLTATPRDYLKRFDEENANDPRITERRNLLDTYKTFGCSSGHPTYRYSLIDGVKDGFLINPLVVDARTEVSTQLLSDKGYSVIKFNDQNEEEEQSYFQRDFEKKFFSEPTNRILCKTFIENALSDPITGEIGKSIVFSVSQNHAAKLTQILNEMADQMFPNKYNSDFAIQVTSSVSDAQQFTINFTNNNLNGNGNFLPEYKTSKSRVCVTVGMMTTGYDCPDILNLALMRPIFSPTDFIQIKGRGTRKHNFIERLMDANLKSQFDVEATEKNKYKLFDFFGNCEFFEEDYQYDQILNLPPRPSPPKTPTVTDGGAGGSSSIKEYENFDPDKIFTVNERQIDFNGMKIDRMFFERFEETIKQDETVKTHVEKGDWEKVIDYLKENILDRPEDYFTLEKLRKASGIDRRLQLREIIEKALGIISKFKSKDELLEEEFDKFLQDRKPDSVKSIIPMKYYFKAYIINSQVRDIIDNGKFAELYTNPTFNMNDFEAVPNGWKKEIPNYIKDYIPLNQFM